MFEIEQKKKNKKGFDLEKKTDVYLYNFLSHKPKYVYTTESKRLEKHQRHYGKNFVNIF